jgi:hypothetical protein
MKCPAEALHTETFSLNNSKGILPFNELKCFLLNMSSVCGVLLGYLLLLVF